jgi:(p)ppGpp synthase/HD superfamily hydrolase
MGTELENRALRFATAAHAAIGQTRKYCTDPYVVHPIRVADIVRTTGVTEHAVAASYLHDTAEDVHLDGLRQAACSLGDYGLDDLREVPGNFPATRLVRLMLIAIVFDDRTAALVEMVTDISQKSDGNRRVRKSIDRDHIARADAEGQTVKLADLIDNAEEIAVLDPDFAHVWMREKRDMLAVLDKGDRSLFARAQAMVDAYFKKD